MDMIVDFDSDIALTISFAIYPCTCSSFAVFSDNAMFFYVSSLLLTFLFGAAAGDRSVFCRVWAALVVVMCSCVFSAKLSADLKSKESERLQAFEMRIFEVSRELMACRRASNKGF